VLHGTTPGRALGGTGPRGARALRYPDQAVRRASGQLGGGTGHHPVHRPGCGPPL